jgi:hypothetical protein
MSGAIPPLPQYAFMAWCSVKKEAQGQLYLYLYLLYCFNCKPREMKVETEMILLLKIMDFTNHPAS